MLMYFGAKLLLVVRILVGDVLLMENSLLSIVDINVQVFLMENLLNGEMFL